MRQVFFGEGGEGVNSDKSYCVLCHDESSTLPLSSVFLDAYTEKKSPAEFRVVDCNFVLPSSEKTIAERFKLDLTKRPTIFVSGKVGEPKQVSFFPLRNTRYSPLDLVAAGRRQSFPQSSRDDRNWSAGRVVVSIFP